MPTPKAAAASLSHPASEEEAVVVDNTASEENHNNNNNFNLQDEDEHLFRATGFRYSFAQQRGFPYPWCAKKHGRKGWIVRDFPPTAYYATSNPFSTNINATTAENVEFEGWKEAKKVFRTRQILLERFSLQEQQSIQASSIGNNVNTAVTAAAAVQRRAMIDNWFKKTPAVMKQQRKIHNEALQLEAEKKRKREEELDLKKKRQKELRVMKEKERVQQMREKHHHQQQQQVSHQEEIAAAAIENTNMQQTLANSNPESPSRYRPINKQKAVVSSPSRSKRKGTQPIRRDNKYRDIERSFIENQSLLLRSPVRQSHESNELLPSPSTPTRMANPLPQLQSSPTRIKYKRTQPRKNHHHQQHQQLNSSQQSNSVILGDDPLMDQMIEDIVKEFTTDGGGPMVAHGHLFDVGAVSALREAAMDMVVHNLEEKSKVAGTGTTGGSPAAAAAAACNNSSPEQLDHDDKRMELMLEQLIGEVAYDSGCKFDGHAVEALKMAAREIVTTENNDMATPAKGCDQSSARAAADVASKSSGEGKSEETERSLRSPSNPSHDMQPLQLDSEDSNFSEVGGMIAQLVDDLGKETDFQFDASAVDALKKASQQLI